jgi:mannose/cellobiose epimerase-like protein (N-acyl-D-glucosamine 2-epimerase family)
MENIALVELLDPEKLTPFGEKFSEREALRLIDFARGSVVPEGGFGYLNSDGSVDRTQPRELYIQCRMIQVFGLAHLTGIAEGIELVAQGVDTLLDQFLDGTFSGFFSSIDYSNEVVDDAKMAYGHAFVLLAASTAKACGVPRADELLDAVDKVIDHYFWDQSFGLMNNAWDKEFVRCDPYRGVNANMHAVEAFLAAFDVTNNIKYRERALLITQKVVDSFAKDNQWMLPEHFDSEWNPQLDYNKERPADPFCPYGVTIGHLFEWSRLALHVGLQNDFNASLQEWILPDSQSLYRLAKEAGWAADGTAGFIYTMDWNQKPVVRSRMAWVVSEAIMAAYSLWIITNDQNYLDDYTDWWSYAQAYMMDYELGSWFHELSPAQKVITDTWRGKPDVYHLFNTCLLTMYQFKPSFVAVAL